MAKNHLKINILTKWSIFSHFFAYFSWLGAYFWKWFSVLCSVNQDGSFDTHEPYIWAKKIFDPRRGQVNILSPNLCTKNRVFWNFFFRIWKFIYFCTLFSLPIIKIPNFNKIDTPYSTWTKLLICAVAASAANCWLWR